MTELSGGAWLSGVLIGCGVGFFVAGTLGLLRFKAPINRLHALTKADTLGLGLVVLGLSVQAPSWAVVWKLWLILFLGWLSAALVSHLIGQTLRAQSRTQIRTQTRTQTRGQDDF